MNRNRLLIPATLLFLACFSLALALVPDDAIASETWSPIATPWPTLCPEKWCGEGIPTRTPTAVAWGPGAPRRCGDRVGGCK
jgi:hypothetical protein